MNPRRRKLSAVAAAAALFSTLAAPVGAHALSDQTTTPANDYGVSSQVTATWSVTNCNSGGTVTAYRLDKWSAQYFRTYSHRSALVKFKTKAGQTGLTRCYNGSSSTNPDGIQSRTTGDEVAVWGSLLTANKRTYYSSGWNFYYQGDAAFSRAYASALTYDAFGYPAIKQCTVVNHPANNNATKCDRYPAP